MKQIIHTKSTMCRVEEKKTQQCVGRGAKKRIKRCKRERSQLRPPLGVWRVGQVIRRNYLMFLLAWPSNQSMHGNNLPWRNARNHFTKRWTGRKIFGFDGGAADLGVYRPLLSSSKTKTAQGKALRFLHPDSNSPGTPGSTRPSSYMTNTAWTQPIILYVVCYYCAACV